MQILECVPNFSEGKSKSKIKKIADSITHVKGIKILDIQMDVDHNRSVITFIGPPKAVITAAFECIKTASKLIDITSHKGVHPRIGATDVLPLIPLKGLTFKKTIEYAKSLGKKIGKQLKIPVYLYEKAATLPSRKNLADVRNFLIKNLQSSTSKTPIRKFSTFLLTPDFGPTPLSKSANKTSGALALGVRNILIAYNVNLNTTDLNLAKLIAKKIREKNGGLKNVKALGLPLNSKKIVQISMNLTNYKITPPLKVFRKIEKELKIHSPKTKILESEIIGMTPKDALPKNHKKVLKLKTFKASQILRY